MRKLSMKAKRKNSPESEGESEENGVASIARDDNEGEETASEMSDKNTKKSKSKSKKRSSRSRGKQDEQLDETPENEDQEKPAGSEQENGTPSSKGGSKRRKKEEKPAAPSQDEENEDDEYEVEKVVAQRTIKGRRQFLVRWKGYGEDADTWEQEKDLNCPQLIEEFLSEQAEEESSEKTPKSTKSKQAKKTHKKAKKEEEAKGDEENEAGDESKEYEVERIIEVQFKKDKTRSFLIRWKGFSQIDDSWEPEENLNCPELIAKFMEKVETAKKTERRELRANPSLTKPFANTVAAHGRRHSRRNVDKERVTYQGCDE